MEISYRIEPDFFGSQSESLSVRLLGGHLIERIDYPFLGAPIDRVHGTTRPDYKGNLTLSYTVGAWSGSWTQRYVSDTLYNTTWVEGVDIDDNTNPSYSFTNLNFTYSGENSSFGGDWRLSLAINNAFDKNPPINPGGAGARFGSQWSTFNGYDEFGRRYQLSLNMNF
jgi:outer membrane receptor for ferrienterochelin and colicin